MKIFLWKKRRFRLRWDSSPGLSIAGRRKTRLESQRSRKRLFFSRKIFKFFNVRFLINENNYAQLRHFGRKKYNSYLLDSHTLVQHNMLLAHFWNRDTVIQPIALSMLVRLLDGPLYQTRISAPVTTKV